MLHIRKRPGLGRNVVYLYPSISLFAAKIQILISTYILQHVMEVHFNRVVPSKSQFNLQEIKIQIEDCSNEFGYIKHCFAYRTWCPVLACHTLHTLLHYINISILHPSELVHIKLVNENITFTVSACVTILAILMNLLLTDDTLCLSIRLPSAKKSISI